MATGKRGGARPNSGRRKSTPESRAARAEALHGLTVEKVVVAVTESHGLLHEACKKLGVARSILSQYIADHSVCAMAYREAKEAMGDVAEAKLYELIEQGDVRCIMYYLSTVHKNRGYGVGKNADPSAFAGQNNQIYVERINFVAIPSGTYLTKEEAQRPMLKEITHAHNGHAAPAPASTSTPDCLS